jgi:hypothetical protein
MPRQRGSPDQQHRYAAVPVRVRWSASSREPRETHHCFRPACRSPVRVNPPRQRHSRSPSPRSRRRGALPHCAQRDPSRPPAGGARRQGPRTGHGPASATTQASSTPDHDGEQLLPSAQPRAADGEAGSASSRPSAASGSARPDQQSRQVRVAGVLLQRRLRSLAAHEIPRQVRGRPISGHELHALAALLPDEPEAVPPPEPRHVPQIALRDLDVSRRVDVEDRVHVTRSPRLRLPCPRRER